MHEHMGLVRHHPGLGQAHLHGLAEGLMHVHDHYLDLLWLWQTLQETLYLPFLPGHMAQRPLYSFLAQLMVETLAGAPPGATDRVKAR